MAELKTRPNNNSVEEFINQIEQEWKRDDSRVLIDLFKKITGDEPVMWGDSIIGFGNYHLRYESGRELDWMLGGFSPRKTSLTLYLMGNNDDLEAMLDSLGKHKRSVGCLYIKKLADVDLHQLEKVIRKSIDLIKERFKEFN